MIKVNAYVIEIETDNVYKVGIEDVYTGTVCNNGLVDNSVTTFDSALSSVIESMLSFDYDYIEVAQGLSKKGRPCRKYVISIDNGD
jgi:hypothetical protein